MFFADVEDVADLLIFFRSEKCAVLDLYLELNT
jgi:hypothetical protein